MNGPLRLLSVLTRQDDEPGEGAATLARYVDDGHEVMVVTCTGGTGDTDAGGETAAVTETLGVGHHWLGFPEVRPRSGGGPVPAGPFSSMPVAEPTERMVRVLREFRPHVMVVYADGDEPDPDRSRCRRLSTTAFDAAGDPTRFATAGAPWQPLKLYNVREWDETRIGALHAALLAEGLESPYHDWLRDPPDDGDRVTTRVPCGEYFPVREQVLRAHADRLDPDCHWFAVPARVRQAAWWTEDFELARSLVTTALPEDDLFAGITPQ
jgi:mycothiol S-conjugate amidase